MTPEAAAALIRPLVLARGLADEWPRIERALRAAHDAHAGQSRKDGAPYFVHPVRVAAVVLDELTADEPGTNHADLACAALLHDTIEDTPLRADAIEALAGPAVRELVLLLTKEDPAGYATKADRDRLYFERLAAGPVGAAIVKCADRIDNLRDMTRSGWTAAKQRAYIDEARDRILPLARGRAPDAARALESVIEEVERRLR